MEKTKMECMKCGKEVTIVVHGQFELVEKHKCDKLRIGNKIIHKLLKKRKAQILNSDIVLKYIKDNPRCRTRMISEYFGASLGAVNSILYNMRKGNLINNEKIKHVAYWTAINNDTTKESDTSETK